MADPKVGNIKNQKVRVEDYTRMRIQKIPSVSSLPQKLTQEQHFKKFIKSISLMRERYKYLQSLSSGQK